MNPLFVPGMKNYPLVQVFAGLLLDLSDAESIYVHDGGADGWSVRASWDETHYLVSDAPLSEEDAFAYWRRLWIALNG